MGGVPTGPARTSSQDQHSQPGLMSEQGSTPRSELALLPEASSTAATGVTVPVDEPVSKADELFAAKRILDAHWTRALDVPWRVGGCLECEGRNNCRQLDWAIEKTAEVAAIMFGK